MVCVLWVVFRSAGTPKKGYRLRLVVAVGGVDVEIVKFPEARNSWPVLAWLMERRTPSFAKSRSLMEVQW